MPPVFVQCIDPNYSKSWVEELEYIEFFAGDGRVFQEVKGAAYPSCAVDIRYLENVGGGSQTNPFDFLTNAGFAPPGS